jgi:hypothetical protein
MQWPDGMTVRPIQSWPGEFTAERRRAPFSANWGSTIFQLRRELREINARDIVLQVAIPERQFRVDGFPRADAKPDHPGVILSITFEHGNLSWPCDTFLTWQDNVRAITLAMEALRKVDRYGVTKRGEQYTGFRAIGSKGSTPTRFGTVAAAVEYLAGVADVSTSTHDLDEAAIWKRARAISHPDRNRGDQSRWDIVQEAGEVLRAEGLIT